MPTIPNDNIFVPIQADNILPQVPIGQQHPVPRKGIEDDEYRTLHTNKFYANAFLGEQTQPICTHPYVLSWGKGEKNAPGFAHWGMNVGLLEEGELVHGIEQPKRVRSFSRRTSIRTQELNTAQSIDNSSRTSMILGARELDAATLLTTDTHLSFSVNINLRRGRRVDDPKISFPVVQGMGCVTARYWNASPMIQTAGMGFNEISNPMAIGKSIKYRLKDMEGGKWLLYVKPTPGTLYNASRSTKLNAYTIVLPSFFTGTIKLAKNPLGAEGEVLYDRSLNSFATSATLTGTVTDARGTYSFFYTKFGTAPLLMFLLPHHVQSLDPDFKPSLTKLQHRTATKGTATAILINDRITFVEPNLPTTMGFGPWTPLMGNTRIRYPPEMLAFLAGIAERDLRRAMTVEIDQDDTSHAGRALAKFATILWVIKDVLSNSTLATTGAEKLRRELDRYVQNHQRYPLYYDDAWKGVVSNAGFTNAPNADGANTYYSDHHVHYAGFVYAAAVLAYLDPAWLEQGDNRSWTNMLVKDFAESAYVGRDYPFSRSFDWWAGHCWGTGLFEAREGKSVGATGEDGFAAFAVKVWGKVCGDAAMEKRGNLMLAIQARSVAENKVEYTSTKASTDPFHQLTTQMTPITPASAYLHPRAWVREEWDRHFSQGRALVDGSVRGILHANLATMDPRAAYAFFRDGVDGVWDELWIDDAGSRTWYLVWCAGLGGGR